MNTIALKSQHSLWTGIQAVFSRIVSLYLEGLEEHRLRVARELLDEDPVVKRMGYRLTDHW